MGDAEGIGWQHGTMIDGNCNKTQCNYCGKKHNGGGVSRLKQHLAGGDVHVKGCAKCGKEIRNMFKKIIKKNKDIKNAKGKAKQDLQDRMAGLNDYTNRSSEEENYDDQMKMGMRESRETHFEEERRRSVGGERGEGSRPYVQADIGSYFRSSSVREVVDRHRDPSLMRTNVGKKKTIPQMINKGAAKFFNKIFSKWVGFRGLSVNSVMNLFLQPMLTEAGRLGPGVKAPTARDLLGPHLQECKADLEIWINGLHGKWQQYDVTIMCDGWTGPTKKSLVNFMLYCDGMTTYLRSVNLSGDIKDYLTIMKHMKKVIDEVGREHIVQIVTDNGAAFKKAGEQLMKQGYKLFWTPCATHCIDLIMKDVSNLCWVIPVIKKARRITKFCYNHSIVTAMMRAKCKGDIIRPAPTRFATNFLALQSLLDKKDDLKEMFTSPEWRAIRSRYKSKLMKNCEDYVANRNFWTHVGQLVAILKPIVIMLRVVDGDKKPTLGVLHAGWELMVGAITKVTPNNEWLLNIVHSRWVRNLSHHLHEAAYYLNPSVQYGDPTGEIGTNPTFVNAVHSVIIRMVDDVEVQVKCIDEIKTFCDSMGSFSSPQAVHSRTSKFPADWWMNYGSDAPNLRILAIRILAQTASSSGCERNWSTFGMIHSRKRNRLRGDTLNDLVFVHYNLRLKVKYHEGIMTKADKDEIDLATIMPDYDSDGDDPLFDWIHYPDYEQELDEAGRPNSDIAQEMGVDPNNEPTVPFRPVADFEVPGASNRERTDPLLGGKRLWDDVDSDDSSATLSPDSSGDDSTPSSGNRDNEDSVVVVLSTYAETGQAGQSGIDLNRGYSQEQSGTQIGRNKSQKGPSRSAKWIGVSQSQQGGKNPSKKHCQPTRDADMDSDWSHSAMNIPQGEPSLEHRFNDLFMGHNQEYGSEVGSNYGPHIGMNYGSQRGSYLGSHETSYHAEYPSSNEGSYFGAQSGQTQQSGYSGPEFTQDVPQYGQFGPETYGYGHYPPSTTHVYGGVSMTYSQQVPIPETVASDESTYIFARAREGYPMIGYFAHPQVMVDQKAYDGYITSYIRFFSQQMTWRDYCERYLMSNCRMDDEPPAEPARHSMYY